jgi:hypothetical protein
MRARIEAPLDIKVSGAEVKEEKLKRRAKERRAIPEEAWAYLEDRGYVAEALDMPFDEEMVEYIIKEFDALVTASPGRVGNRTQAADRSKSRDTVRVSLGELELERKAALEEYLAMCAACDSEIYLFRKRVLGGETLSKREAWELIRSWAARILPIGLFEAWEIPFIGHTSTLDDYTQELVTKGKRHLATITVQPPSITKKVQMTTWAGISETDKQRLVGLEYPNEEGKVRGVEIWSISLLGELRELGEKLSNRYRWQPAQAVWFVLTGEIPAAVALQTTRSFVSSMYHRDTLITVEAAPWVSSKTVERAFRKAQIKTLGSGGGRPPGEKNLKLFRFVTERIEPLGLLEEEKRPPKAPEYLGEIELVANHWYMKAPEGKELVSEWNETYPQWSYKSDTRRFWRDYNRIRKTVAVGPPYEW